ncbi:MAG: hypothetical protein RMJ81_06100 [Candidatus Kryptonium sp.]|nr:hypothetical protein [Candidatus Kryptonium sp.]MDW8109208.1 hypothetical protein [Candidatus Kryptonium sp.]
MKNYVSFVLSVFFAFFLWVIVNLNGEYEENFKAKVVLKNLHPERAIKNNYPEFVNLKLKGRGWKILPFYFLSQPNVLIDLSGVQRNVNLNLLGDHRVKIPLPENVSILRIEPETLNFELDRKVEKKVPVVFVYEINKENTGFAYPPRVFPDSVVISGAESVISKIDAVFTDKVLIEKTGQEISVRVKISNPNEKLIKLSDNFAQVKFLAEQIVEREFIVPVYVIESPSDKEVILFPPNIKVVVRGVLSKLVPTELNKDTVVKAYVSYRDVVNDKTGLIKPQIILSEHLNLVSVSPEGLEYIIRQK